jgi:hypothetical protein
MGMGLEISENTIEPENSFCKKKGDTLKTSLQKWATSRKPAQIRKRFDIVGNNLPLGW